MNKIEEENYHTNTKYYYKNHSRQYYQSNNIIADESEVTK